MILTLWNAKEILLEDDAIQISFIYSYRSKKYWRVIKPIHIRLRSGKLITIPAGFVTDLSSSPRWLWSIAPPFGDFLLAALIHDFLYVYCIGTRKKADKEMLIWSMILNDNWLDNMLRYFAVRLFGGSWWRKSMQKFKK